MLMPDQDLAWPIPWRAVELIAEREGCRLRAYLCSADVWTCGWGETAGVSARTVWTQAYADQRFADSLRERADAVLALCTRLPTPNELGAMVSLHYNIGHKAFSNSSVLRAHNRGDSLAAARAFALWNKATVRGRLTVLAGLTARRAAEAALYLLPDSDETSAPAEAMPQAVVGESPLAGSPIATSGAVTAGAGALGLLAQVPEQLGPVQSAVAAVKSLLGDTLGIPPSTAMALVLVAAGATVVWWRWQQRRQGWA